MAKYTLQTQRGRTLTIESDSPENAMQLADQWDLEDHAVSEAQRLGVSPDLALRQMQAESGGNPSAVSPKGARGLMQLMPGTAKDLGVDPDDPYQNITGGLTYYKQQVDRFGGDERKALAAYNAGPGAVEKYGDVPPYAETQGYVDKLSPQGQPKTPPPIGGPALAQARAAAPQAAPRKDQALGFVKGAFAPIDHASNWAKAGIEKTALADPLAQIGAKLRGALPEGLVNYIDDPKAYYAKKAAQGIVPGKIGEFAGNVAGTLPLGGGSGFLSRPLIQGAVSGALLSDAKDARGVATDAVIGGATGRLADLGLTALGKGAAGLLSKAPKVMSPPQLKAAVDAAYDKVRAAGITIPKADAQALAGDIEALIRTRGGPKAAKLYADADALSAQVKALASQKGGIPIAQLEELRGDIYDVLVRPGGKESGLGKAMRQKIDGVMDQVAGGNPLLREARALNARWKKADFVQRASQSADIRAEKDYGGDYGRKLKDRLFPLIDPANPKKNFRGATPDELAAIEQIVRGTKTQNAASTVGGMLDPRRLGGKIATNLTAAGGGAGALFTGGASLLIPAAQMAAGFGLTGKASSIARKNADELLRLIAVGGSKQALKKVPTKAARAVQTGLVAVRPAAVAGAAAGSSNR